MKTLLFSIFASFLLVSAQAQNNAAEHTIQVSGTAELEIVPDEIYMTITLKEFVKEKRKFMIEELENGMVNYLQKVVLVDKKDIKMESLDARLVAMKRKKNKDEMISKSYEVKLKTSKQVIDVFLGMDSLSINTAYISKYSHSKMEEYKKQIKINAIKAARDKADYLMAAIMQKAGKAVRIEEPSGFVTVEDGLTRNIRNTYGYAQSNSFSSGRLSMDEDIVDEAEHIGEKTIKLKYTINAWFLIE